MLRTLGCAVLLAGLAGAAAGQSCMPRWTGDFSSGGPDDDVTCMATYDDGSGPALYIGGSFHAVGSLRSRGVAKWNGTAWQPLPGNAPWPYVNSMVVFDDGHGPGLYVADGGLLRWDRNGWQRITENGALRDIQLLGGAREALMARGGFEGPQGIERGQASHGEDCASK